MVDFMNVLRLYQRDSLQSALKLYHLCPLKLNIFQRKDLKSGRLQKKLILLFFTRDKRNNASLKI